MWKVSLRACPAAATAPWMPNTDAVECCCQRAPARTWREVIERRAGTVAAAASRMRPVGAARAYASRGNDARQAAAAFDPTDEASRRAKLAGHLPAPHTSRPTTYLARKGKVWLPPLGLNFPARPGPHRFPLGSPQDSGLPYHSRETTYSGCSRRD